MDPCLTVYSSQNLKEESAVNRLSIVDIGQNPVLIDAGTNQLHCLFLQCFGLVAIFSSVYKCILWECSILMYLCLIVLQSFFFMEN